MKTLQVKGGKQTSTILVGESIDDLKKYIEPKRTIVLTDENVNRYYRERFPECPVVEVGLGEKIKTLDTVASIFERLVALEADRSSFILGIGGGIVCDIAGFVASTYMRGTRFGFVSTTLLSQVDASVGGKNGVNFGGYKNMVGVFNQPEFVVCDLDLLKTLPRRELLCGFAEIIKHGAIADFQLLEFTKENSNAALELDAGAIGHLVCRSVEIKAGVVSRDEREQGERRKLNFGHTFGHAIEKITGIPHGEAVGVGMVLAAKLSVEKGFLAEKEAAHLEKIIRQYGLPVAPPMSPSLMLETMRKDKKREREQIHFVFLDALGRARVEEISFGELSRLTQKL